MQTDPFGKYARWELERRFLLERVPEGTTGAVRIADRYIRGTRLRLRFVDAPTAVYKLGQKIRPAPDDPSVVALTNIYLSASEHERFVSLAADELVKMRHHIPVDDRTMAIDVFEGALTGLILAEANFPSRDAMEAFVPPAFAIREVTADDRYSGGSLARTTVRDAAALLHAG